MRPRSKLAELERLGVSTVRADVRDRRAVRRAMRDVERVFHAAGTTNSEAAPRAGIRAERRGDPDRARGGAASRRRAGRLHVLGGGDRAGSERLAPPTSATSGMRHATGSRTSTPSTRPRSRRCGLFDRGLPLVIVNPAHVLGAGDPGRSSTVLVRRFLRREIHAYVDGTLNIVGVGDVARGHLLADERGVPGERYILGNRNFTLDRLFTDLARLSGVEPPPLKLPVHAALLMACTAQPVLGRADAAALRRSGRRRSTGRSRAPGPSASSPGGPRRTRTASRRRSRGIATARAIGCRPRARASRSRYGWPARSLGALPLGWR